MVAILALALFMYLGHSETVEIGQRAEATRSDMHLQRLTGYESPRR